jgi:two-component system nitrogen regulation sensor histidine kinase NtrY
MRSETTPILTQEKEGGPRHTALIMVLAVAWLALTVIQWRMFKAVGGGGSPLDTIAVFALVNVNILILLLLLFLILRNIAKLLLDRKRGVLGARLKTKLVLAFLATTAIPTTVLFLTSAGFLAQSIDSWFTTRVDNALTTAMEVARSHYANEEQQLLWAGRTIGESAAVSLEREPAAKPVTVAARLRPEAERLGLSSVQIFLAEAELRIPIPGAGGVPEWVSSDSAELRDALSGGKASTRIVRVEERDYLRAVAPLERDGKVVGAVVADRLMPAWTLNRLDEIRRGYEEYRQTQLLKAPLKVSYIFPLLLVALLILFAVTWLGFRMAKNITEPIGALAEATQRVAGGDLNFQLKVATADEVGTLVRYFNVMTRDLLQTNEKVEAAQETLRRTNVELEARRIYMEAVLERITAGVVGTDAGGRITTANPAAAKMLALPANPKGMAYGEVFPPEAAGVVEEIFSDRKGRKHMVQRQVILPGEGMRRTVMVHVTRLRDESGAALGMVVVLNDLTDLAKAERAQAWREVARRIAHEIKNPLTPIQLSAQRLRRRYSELLEEAEGEVLDEATRTIVAQVDGLKYMVNEFSRFAKMPEAHPAPADINALVADVIGLYRPAHAEIRFDVQFDQAVPAVEVDAEQIKRALVNLLDNAVSALEGLDYAVVEVLTQHDPVEQVVRVVIADNGPGLAPAARERLFEPYFSTKKSGTGLGLAIVKSIMDDHRGYVRAVDNRPQGTRFILEFPLSGANA